MEEQADDGAILGAARPRLLFGFDAPPDAARLYGDGRDRAMS